MYHEVQRAFAPRRGAAAPANNMGGRRGAVDASQVLAELASKSRYQAAVRADVDRHGALIEGLIRRVKAFKAEDMAALRRFVEEVDGLLDGLTDQAAVLRHFPWPHARYDAFREAVGLQAELEEKKRVFGRWPREGGARADGLKKIVDYTVSWSRGLFPEFGAAAVLEPCFHLERPCDEGVFGAWKSGSRRPRSKGPSAI